MTHEPETERLLDRLVNDETKELVNFHVSWGPKAHLLSSEERAAFLNRALDDPGIEVTNIDEWDGDSGTQI